MEVSPIQRHHSQLGRKTHFSCLHPVQKPPESAHDQGAVQLRLLREVHAEEQGLETEDSNREGSVAANASSLSFVLLIVRVEVAVDPGLDSRETPIAAGSCSRVDNSLSPRSRSLISVAVITCPGCRISIGFGNSLWCTSLIASSSRGIWWGFRSPGPRLSRALRIFSSAVVLISM